MHAFRPEVTPAYRQVAPVSLTTSSRQRHAGSPGPHGIGSVPALRMRPTATMYSVSDAILALLLRGSLPATACYECPLLVCRVLWFGIDMRDVGRRGRCQLRGPCRQTSSGTRLTSGRRRWVER